VGAVIRLALCAAALGVLVAPAAATAPPVGPLPPGPTIPLAAKAGHSFRITVARQGVRETIHGARRDSNCAFRRV
jgi:hypothetical protein